MDDFQNQLYKIENGIVGDEDFRVLRNIICGDLAVSEVHVNMDQEEIHNFYRPDERFVCMVTCTIVFKSGKKEIIKGKSLTCVDSKDACNRAMYDLLLELNHRLDSCETIQI